MKKQSIIQSFNAAIEGFIYVVKTQRNMRLHFLITVLVLLLAIYLDLEKLEILLLLVTISVVLLAEMMNTAIEMNIDLIADQYNPMARIIKDITAGCVLVSSLSAFIVGYLIFFSRPWGINIQTGIDKIRSSPWHISLVVLIIVLTLVVLGKVIFHRGTPLRGGLPSGHAAIAFSVWTIIAFSTANQMIIVLSFILAFLVARSRLSGGIHTFWEVVAGTILGIASTVLIFQILG